MDSPIRILFKPKESNGDYLDVTNNVSIESFPEYFEKSLKGKGWFEFEVKSFSFRMLSKDLNPIPKRLDWIRIYSSADDSLLMDGFIDEIKDELANDPNYTIFPNALLIKDTIIGVIEESDEEDDENYLFDSGETLPLHELVSNILNEVNTKAGTNFTTSEEAIPVVPSTNKNFFGNLLDKIRKWDFINVVLGFLFPTFNLADTFTIRRKLDSDEPSGYKYYLIKKDAGLFSKTFIQQGAFLSFTPSWGFYLGWPFNKTYGFSWHIFAPGSDWRLPVLLAKYYVYRLQAGGMGDFGEPNSTFEWFPSWPWSEGPPGLSNTYGSVYNSNQSSNVNAQKMTKFLDEEGYSNPDVVTTFDYDAGNTYAVLSGKPKKFDLSPWAFFTSFETPFDNYYRVTYKNTTAGDILKDLSIVSNRFFYVDDDNVVYMTPRNTDQINKIINKDDIIDLKQNTIKEEDPNIDFNAYTTDDKGKIQSYGVRVRQREKEGVLAYYKKYFQGDRIERVVELYTGNTDIDIKLMDTIEISADEDGIGSQVLGRVIKTDISFLENKRKFVCEISSDFADLSSETGGGGIDEPGNDDNVDNYINLYQPQSHTYFGHSGGFTLTLSWLSQGVPNVNIILQVHQGGYWQDIETIFSNMQNNGSKSITLSDVNSELRQGHSYGVKVQKYGEESEVFDLIRPIYPNYSYNITE